VANTIVEGAAAELSLVWRTPDFVASDRAALQVLAALLGRGPRSRLDDELVRNRQLATQTSAFLFAGRDGGVLVSRAVLGAGLVDDVARAMLDEVARLATDGPTTDELRRARMVAEMEEAAQKAGLDGYAARLALYATLGGDPDAETQHVKRLRALDVDQVRKAAARYLRSGALTVLAGIPPGNARAENKVATLTGRLRAVVSAVDSRGPARPSKVSPPSLVRDVVTYALPSGVRVLIFPDDGADEVAVRAVWSGGVRIEDNRLSGATSLLARLLVRATKTRTTEQLNAELAAVGGRMEGIAGLDALGLRGDFLGSGWERGLDLVVDCLRNPRFSEDDLEQDRRVLLDAIRLRDEDAGAVATRLFDDSLFGRHPYHQDVLGTVDSVATLTRRRLLDFYRARYRPRGLTVVVVGPVDPTRVAEKLQALFADASMTDAPTVAAGPIAANPFPREVVRFADVGLARVVLGYPGVNLRDPDRLALDVLAEVLTGAGQRFASLLRSRRGPLDDLVARSQVGVEPGRFSLHATVRPEQVEAAVAALRLELAKLLESGVTADEVAAARRNLIGKRALALERRGAVASALAFGAALGDPARPLRRDSDELASVRPEDVLRAARRIIDPKREVLAVIRPRADRASAGRGNAQRSAAALGAMALRAQER
ncbi:MAG TPA: insulinase family protein, partial [Polyangia bacterium]|nr:insulinase family protein [Polyangia bacterium]